MQPSIGNRLVPALLVLDMPQTLAFYQQIGFAVSKQFPEGTSPTWAQVRRDGISLQFHTQPPHGTPPTPICSGTFYMYPKNIDAVANELRQFVKFEWGPELMNYGHKEFGIKDPNGYYLAFSQTPE